MYLKEIRAHGFKSFADKVSIELNNNVTGIVGPNGSGKSNVVDAIRWVLGEQSVKSLRGSENMTDVIFSGSKSRNSLNVASVTLVFDNSDNYLPLAFNEVSIKRRVYRDGTNEYHLNGEKCRLKDIIDILLDSGIAKESFNIISQGKIEEIISNKPQERRIIFEEAAGVLKYKKRKEEAIRKLDRTHLNMTRIEDIIGELETQIMPLKIQKEQALEYLDLKRDLEDIEIALVATEITSLNNAYKQKKGIIEQINQELFSMSTNSSTDEAKIINLKTKIDALDGEINSKQKELIDVSAKMEQANSKKNIISERKKYEVEDSKLHQTLTDSKEKIAKTEVDISSLKSNIELKEKEIELLEIKKEKEEAYLDELKKKKNSLDFELSNKYRTISNIEHKINSLQNYIDNNGVLPAAVKAVLEHPKLNGIHNVLGNIVDVEKEYSTAIAVCLGFAASNIVAENEHAIKEAIAYLKSNNLGRATFYPMNVIKPKGIDPDTLKTAANISSFVSIASDIVSYDKIYHNVVINQLGNIIIANNLDGANIIAKKIGYKYRVVTLDGQVIHAGGTVTGGSSTTSKNIISMKHDLEELINEEKELKNSINETENKIKVIDGDINQKLEKFASIDKEYIALTEAKNVKIANKIDLEASIESLKLETSNISKKLDGSLSNEEEKAIDEYYGIVKIREELNNAISLVVKVRNSKKEELEEAEHEFKSKNTVYNSKTKELNSLEIEVNRMDVKIDSLLNILNESYNMTYEKAIEEYKLELEVDTARKQVDVFKNRIKNIGMVNLGAIDEYDRVSVRYEFLIKQKEDLTNAENTLLEIISEMDKVMIEDFVKTFELIKKEFSLTFKDLFKGGNAELKLTNPDDILGTGIEIIASPPGKKLTSISLLSGGEKTFTAISLLFAILKSKFVPFCVLDEVEAALDEVNVDSFGKYLRGLAKKTQFIVITHKKKTMEFVDNLYGITMQESGVSKLVSVKLEDVK